MKKGIYKFVSIMFAITAWVSLGVFIATFYGPAMTLAMITGGLAFLIPMLYKEEK